MSKYNKTTLQICNVINYFLQITPLARPVQLLSFFYFDHILLPNLTLIPFPFTFYDRQDSNPHRIIQSLVYLESN